MVNVNIELYVVLFNFIVILSFFAHNSPKEMEQIRIFWTDWSEFQFKIMFLWKKKKIKQAIFLIFMQLRLCSLSAERPHSIDKRSINFVFISKNEYLQKDNYKNWTKWSLF